MRKKYIIILILIVLVVGSLTGFPFPTKIEKFGCSASYEKLYFPNFLCQFITNGHCSSTSLNKHNAEVKLNYCLCEEFESSPNIDLEKEILSNCRKQGYNCESSDINFICQNKEDFFRFINIR